MESYKEFLDKIPEKYLDDVISNKLSPHHPVVKSHIFEEMCSDAQLYFHQKEYCYLTEEESESGEIEGMDLSSSYYPTDSFFQRVFFGPEGIRLTHGYITDKNFYTSVDGDVELYPYWKVTFDDITPFKIGGVLYVQGLYNHQLSVQVVRLPYHVKKIMYGKSIHHSDIDFKPSDINSSAAHRLPIFKDLKCEELFIHISKLENNDLEIYNTAESLNRWGGRVEIITSKKFTHHTALSKFIKKLKNCNVQ